MSCCFDGCLKRKSAPGKKTEVKTGAAKKAAKPVFQPAEQPPAQPDAEPAAQYNACINSSVVGNTGGKLISTALPKSSAKGPLSMRSSPSFGNESTMPSTKPVSKESQARKRSNLDPLQSLEGSVTFSNKFSTRNATN